MSSMADISKMFGSSGEPARPNLFKVIVPFLGRDFEFKVRAASMPSANVPVVNINYLNRTVKRAGDREYEEWVTTLYLDENHEVRQDLIEWQDKCHAMGVRIHGALPAEYLKPAFIQQISRDGETVTKEYQMTNIWPSIVGEVPGDWDTKSEVSYFDVTWAYDWWEAVKN